MRKFSLIRLPAMRLPGLACLAALCVGLAAGFAAGPSALAAPIQPAVFMAGPDVARTPRVEARLVTSQDILGSGGDLWLALRLKMEPGWHTYWRNPGDSGEPTALDLMLPEGFVAGPIQWPAPHRLPAGPLMNYGYEGEVLLPLRIAVPSTLPSGPFPVRARASWLVCNPEQCIPEEATLALTLRPGAPRVTRWAEPITQTLAALPRTAQGWTLAARQDPGGVRLDITPPPGVAPADLAYFPYDEGRIDNAAPQPLERHAGGMSLRLPRSPQPLGEFDRVHGLLVSSGPIAADGVRAVEIELPVGAASPSSGVSEGSAPTLWIALLLAFAGGLILNLMPCVLPVLSIKVLGFAQSSRTAGSVRGVQGLLYALGVLVSFWILAALLIGLKSAGLQIGWGFQLQSPLFVALLAMLFFAIALNLSGVYEFSMLLPSRLAAFQARNARADAFFTGVLAVLVASPCTAPFMGAALGYALAESAVNAFAVFTALGLGMALPYALLERHPAWLRWMPRPGPWMVRLRQLLAFPLYGTVVWLAWVLGIQTGLDGVIALAAALVALGFAAWMAGLSGRFARPAAVLLALAALGGGATLGVPGEGASLQRTTAQPGDRGEPGAEARWEPYSEQRIASLAAEGRPVFVDFTAAWCVTCQVNKKLVLSRPEVEQEFARRGVALMRADWTRRDPEITRALASMGRAGVPVYVLHVPGATPRLLPEILTREAIESALSGLADAPGRRAVAPANRTRFSIPLFLEKESS